MIGQTIAQYKILEELGRGGMGVVYKAEDTKLGRTAAVKVLTEQAGTTASDRERFIREARLAAVLNHPNIATVYEISTDESTPGGTRQMFIAMEYVEGRSLREMIDAGPLKIDEAVRILTQAAEGLHAAHEKKVVHRDVKSANIMVTPKGQVKIMDFGLAKMAQGRTMITAPGSTLGTAAYMSPEQARGEGVDHRTDIWGLGVVFYEMITGTLPFRGDYANAVIYAILHEEPAPLTAVRTGVPVALDAICAKMLAKDPSARYQHVEEIPVDLRNVGSRPESGPMMTVSAAQPSGRSWPWAAAGCVLGAVIMAAVLQLLGFLDAGSRAQPEVQRWSIALPDSMPLAPVGSAPLGIGQPSIAISPDGSLIVCVIQRASGTLLFLRSPTRYELLPLEGTDNAYHPFFSPDGRWIGFFAGNQLKKVSVGGGAVITLCEATNPRGAVWGKDDRIYFGDTEGTRVRWVASSGGTVGEFEDASDRSFGGFEYPSMLPDGKAMVCGSRTQGVKVVMLPAGGEKILSLQGSSPRYVKSGHLVFYSRGSLLALPFDPEHHQLRGTPTPVIDGVLAEVPNFGAHFDVSQNGTLVYVPGTTDIGARLVMVHRDGTHTVLPFPPAQFGTFQISPDGRRLVIMARVLGTDIWMYDLEQGSRTRITTDGTSGYPIWSPDGKWIVYASGAGEHRQVVREQADGSGRRQVIDRGRGGSPYGFSPDGGLLAITRTDSATGNDLMVIDLGGARDPVMVAGTRASEWGAAFSRDGKYIAYVSDESGEYEVYVQPFPPDGRRWQVSTEGGEEPIWSGAGKELFYRRGQEWVSAAVTTSPGFAVKRSTVALSGAYVNVGGRSYDVTGDGKRFLVLERMDAHVRLTEIRVVTDWFQELEQKVKVH